MTRIFSDLINARWDEGRFVCVGLDSDLTHPKFPSEIRGDTKRTKLLLFNMHIVDATRDLVCAYKPNIAFYESLGAEGISVLVDTVRHINRCAPEIPIIGDMKRGDIGNTNLGYIRAAFEVYGFDAITVPPYMGKESLQPFLDMKDKGIIILCRTSNPGADEFQDLPLEIRDLPAGVEEFFVKLWGVTGKYDMAHARIPLYRYVAYRVAHHWNENGNCCLVVGATYPEELEKVRQTVGDLPILLPGIGFQQKGVPLEEQVEQTVSAGKDSQGRGMIINSARDIIFASSGPGYAEAARRETLKLHNLIIQYR